MIEQRKARRFELKLPFELVRNGSHAASQTGQTKNLSSMGVLFTAEIPFLPGDAVEYLITLPTAPNGPGVRIRCLGKVVRFKGSEIAATLERYEFVRTNPNPG
ncbi:MAG: PilZ domain-containing protein [Acidobacteriota bacterium]|nr:PilZ domain-containing protein [Acidobacteriota bacterium]